MRILRSVIFIIMSILCLNAASAYENPKEIITWETKLEEINIPYKTIEEAIIILNTYFDVRISLEKIKMKHEDLQPIIDIEKVKKDLVRNGTPLEEISGEIRKRGSLGKGAKLLSVSMNDCSIKEVVEELLRQDGRYDMIMDDVSDILFIFPKAGKGNEKMANCITNEMVPNLHIMGNSYLSALEKICDISSKILNINIHPFVWGGGIKKWGPEVNLGNDNGDPCVYPDIKEIKIKNYPLWKCLNKVCDESSEGYYWILGGTEETRYLTLYWAGDSTEKTRLKKYKKIRTMKKNKKGYSILKNHIKIILKK